MSRFLFTKNCLNGLNRLISLLITVTLMLPAIAQQTSKLSVSTQMFINELKTSTDATAEASAQRARARQLGLKLENKPSASDRFVANPDTINGIVYMSAYVRVTDPSAYSELEALGVVIQEQFLNGKLITALIPVDRIESVADIAKVSRINASTMMRASTHIAREQTHVDDILTHSADAISAGLPTAFDGSGVVLGVIDTGIDFNHIAFKDKNGNSRIKKAYVYNGSTGTEYSTISSSTLTDDNTADHGTHTSTTAGGSSVTVSGTTVTVTDDHANATYGGMAPGADLYLAGIKDLSSTYLSNAVNKMVSYADAQGKPLVVSNSWGSQFGPHDGTGDEADIYNSLFGNDYPNRVALFAASNDGGKSKDDEGGGYHVSKSATSSSPLRTIIRDAAYSNTDAGYYYYGVIANAWARNTSTSSMTCKIYVLDSSTGAVKTTITVSPSANGTSVSGLSSYYSGTLYAFKDYVDSEKTQILLYTSGLTSRSTSSSTKNGSTYYTSKYTLAVEFAPSSGTSVIDVWGGSSCYFTNHLSTSGYTWTAGSDDMCVSDEATISNIISIGAYVSANTWTDYNGTAHNASDTYPDLGDIAYFSSYATAAESPTGLQYPWITAPGARLIAGVNHNHTTSVDSYSYYGSNYNSDLVVNSTTSPYAEMEGTSMATPTAAGIVALWLQAANTDEGKQNYPNGLTVNDVKNIMKETAIHDTYTDSGSNASHFGNGKIDALAGIEYILPQDKPTITASPTTLDFGEITAGTSTTQTFTVTGANLESDISLSLSNSSNFALSSATVSKAAAEADGTTITVTFTTPANVSATYTGTITLTADNATSVTVSLTGKGKYTAPAISASPTTLAFSGVISQTYTKNVTVSGTNLQGNITAAISGGNGIYSVSPTTITAAEAAAGKTLTITYAPTAGGTTGATLNLTTTGTGAGSASVAITGTAEGPSITTDPASTAMTAYIGQSATQDITVGGTYLESDISLSLSGTDSGVFSINTATITKSAATQGTTFTITYSPTAVGTHSATVTLSSTNCTPVTVTVSGTALAATPTLIVNPTTLTFSADAGQTDSQTFAVTGRFISDDVTLTLTDNAGVFSLATATIPAANISETTAINVTVSFSADDDGDYSGLITLSSNGAESQTITLSGTVNTGGTAADPYLNIAKYATITEAGIGTFAGTDLYQYTEYADNECAWLTMPAHGAYAASSAQGWITTGTISYTSTGTWAASTPFLGNTSYYSSKGTYLSYKTGGGSATEQTETFYVTNCTAVQAYLLSVKTESSNPTPLTAYVCTDNNGTLTASSTAAFTGSHATNSSTGSVAISGMDETKIYKVVLSWKKAYIYEVAFQTPLPAVSPADMVADANVNKYYRIADGTLEAVMLSADGKRIFCKDNGYYANPSEPADDEIDYIMDMTSLNGNSDWDQSNWVALELDDEWSATDVYNLIGSVLNNVRGTLTDATNPVLKISADNKPQKAYDAENPYMYNLNTFITCNFTDNEQHGTDGHTYFFVLPKPMEVVNVAWAMWDAVNQWFTVPISSANANTAHLNGGFYINNEEYNGDMPELEDEGIYNFIALVKKEDATVSKTNRNARRKADADTDAATYMVYPLDGMVKVGQYEDNGVYTFIHDVTSGNGITEVARYNVQGMRIEGNDYHGIAIIVMSDGTVRKVLMK